MIKWRRLVLLFLSLSLAGLCTHSKSRKRQEKQIIKEESYCVRVGAPTQKKKEEDETPIAGVVSPLNSSLFQEQFELS